MFSYAPLLVLLHKFVISTKCVDPWIITLCVGVKVFNRVNKVQQLGSVDLPCLEYVGAKCDDKHISGEIDVPYSGYNGENC